MNILPSFSPFTLVALIVAMLATNVISAADPPEGKLTKKHVEITITTAGSEVPSDDLALMQVALLLDTSNSMDGLINQAQAQMWSIVNSLAEKERDGRSVRLEVALFEYGNNSLPVTENYIRQVVPLTDDLDRVSEALFGLTTNGGSEYCGAVIEEARSVLKWQPGKNHYKAIFIAGNEPFTQGDVHYVSACAQARAAGVNVNTIHCGSKSAGVTGKWQHGAKIGGGDYLTINQDQIVSDIRCPQDEELLKLNIQLNSTYIPFGAEGGMGQARQQEQDDAASEVAVKTRSDRIVSKAKSNAYRNTKWDLVDAVAEDASMLEALADDDLPAELREKSVEERRELVTAAKSRRKAIQDQISRLAEDRAAYIKKERSKSNEESKKNSLGDAVEQVLQKQTNERGYE